MTSPSLNVLYEDNHLLGVYKPGGVLVQGDRTGDTTLLELSKRYLKETHNKPGNVFLGLVHRIDRPVSGVVMFARTSKAASRLANEFRLRKARKVYLAVVSGLIDVEGGELHNYIERAHLRSRVAAAPSDRAKEARLRFSVLDRCDGTSLLEVEPETGRHHQIRLQLSELGYPIVGDLKYGAVAPLEDKTIALHAAALDVKHPTRDERVRISAPPPAIRPWLLYKRTIDSYF